MMNSIFFIAVRIKAFHNCFHIGAILTYLPYLRHTKRLRENSRSLDFTGGEGGIRTHGGSSPHLISSQAPSTTRTPLHWNDVTHVCCHAFYGIIFIQARQGLSLPRTGAQACTRALSDTLTAQPTQKERGCEKSNKNAFSFRGVDMPVAYQLGPAGLG